MASRRGVAYRPESKAFRAGTAGPGPPAGVFTVSLRRGVDNGFMALAVWFIRLLEVLFFTGLVGSAVVVLISFFEDFKELFGED